MYKMPEYDMYDFIDDGVHKSIYTILHEYHPQLKRDFSLASLINHMTEFETTPGQQQGFIRTYEKDFERLAKLLLEKTSTSGLLEGNSERVSKEELNRIFDELKEASKDNPDCKFFATIKEYIDYAKRTVSVPENKPLRDAVVTNAVTFMPRDEIDFARAMMLKSIYLAKAEDKVRAVNHKSREPGQYPEWDRLVAIRHILQKNNGLREYDEFYDEATAQIRTEALKAMEKARVSTVCKMKRAKEVKKGLAPTLESPSKDGRVLEIPELFDKLKRIPQKNENAWAYESFKNPELICDLEANYSEKGIENQRVIAFRYGRLKYKNVPDIGGFNIDRTAEMPELIGVSRIGKDGTKTYFVLMPPMDRLTFKPLGEKPQDPGDKPYGFTITQDIEVPTRSGGTKIKRQTTPAELVDGRTGERLTAFRNREIPEHLKEFFAKVYFSDEYLSNAIEHNARYIGTVVETDNGPQIRTSDVGKANLVAAHYAVYHPGTVDRITTPSFDRYCSGSELEIRQYNLINDLERKKAKEKESKPKNDEPR